MDIADVTTVEKFGFNVNLMFPSKRKYKNICLAGDWIDTGLPATIEGAITSGYNVANYINKI